MGVFYPPFYGRVGERENKKAGTPERGSARRGVEGNERLGVVVFEDQSVARFLDEDGVRLVDLAAQDGAREIVEQEVLQGALHGTSTEIGVVALFGEEGHGVVVDAEGDALRFEAARHGGDVQAHDLFDLAAAEGVEHENVVDAVDKLRPQARQRGAGGRKAGRGESCHELLARTLAVVVALRRILGREEVGGHDDDGVLEVHRPTLVIGEAAVVEDRKSVV